MPSIRIPFPGFYNTEFSAEIDFIEEREAEYFESDESADNYDFSGKLSASEFGELMYWHTDYLKYFQYVAREYVDYFNEWIKDEYDLDLGLTFEEMKSPREYNFETDKIYCTISEEKVLELFHKVNDLDPDDKLNKVIEDHLKSRSGFISFYSEFVRGWKNKPVLEWDYNELYMLLEFLIEGSNCYGRIYDRMSDAEVFYTARNEAFDFKSFEEAVNDKISETEGEEE